MTPDNRKLIIEGATLILQGLGVDLTDHNFVKTPERVAKVYEELFTPKETEWPVFDEAYTDMVIMRGHVFYTMCPHHMLPVEITASVAYIPGGQVIGASKLCRMLHEANRQPMTQELLTAKALEAVDKLTGGTSRGAAIALVGEHGCFRMRGVKSGASMVTLKYSGEFEKHEQLQNRFLQLVKL